MNELLSMALEIHGSYLGYNDPISQHRCEELEKILSFRLKNWKPSCPPQAENFDNAVKKVLEQAHHELVAYMQTLKYG